MEINKLVLRDFRNYDLQEIEFNSNINVFFGNNAQGKTNIIEAIFLCSYGKSFRARKDEDLIKFEKNQAIIELYFSKVDRNTKIKVNIRDKKVFFINNVKQEKISDIVGKLNVVIFTPDDINIIKGEPDKRRRFIDMMISSLRPNYIHLLNNYKKVLEERNNYLKQIKNKQKEVELLDLWDEQLADYSEKINKYRTEFIDKIKNKIQDIHNLITKSGKEEIKIHYENSGKNKDDYLKKLKQNRKVDILRGYTSSGIHREDLLIYINKKLVNNYGSQGQQRTAILTLKLCELEIIKDEIGETPILLLDDYMSELDEIRRKSFLESIKDCQIILTCTDEIELDNNYKKFKVENGICSIIE